MSRRAAISAFWLFGFGIGFVGYLAFPSIINWFEAFLPGVLNEAIIGALIAGIVGSGVSTFTVLTWASKT